MLELGRRNDAVIAAQAGLDALPKSDSSLNEDRYLAVMLLGRVAEASLDYATAYANYSEAEPLAPDLVNRVKVLRAKMSAGMFVNPVHVTADAKALIGIVDGADSAKFDKASRGVIFTTISQLYLNAHDYDAALADAKRAVTAFGGLGSTNVDLNDVAAAQITRSPR